MIDRQIVALDMEALTNRMKHLQLEYRIIIQLNQLWDTICPKSSARHTVEVTCEQNGMEVTVGELRVPALYFMNERKFWQKIQQLLKLQIPWDQWLRKIIHENFVSDWIEEPFTPSYLRRTKAFIIEQ